MSNNAQQRKQCSSPQQVPRNSSSRLPPPPSQPTADASFSEDVLASIRHNLAAGLPTAVASPGAKQSPLSTASNSQAGTPSRSISEPAAAQPSCSTQLSSPPAGTSALQNPKMRVRFEYKDVRRAIMMETPLKYDELVRNMQYVYENEGDSLVIRYTIPTEEVLAAIESQHDLDQAVAMLQWSGVKSLRLVLQRRQWRSQAKQSESGRLSPPPGIRKLSSPNRGRPRLANRSQRNSSNIPEIIPYKSTASSKAQSRASVNNFKYTGVHWAGGGGRGAPNQSAAATPLSSNSSGIVPDDISGLAAQLAGGFQIADNLGSATSPQPPRNWRTGKLLGSGTFGQVYQCYDVDRGRQLAVKSLSFQQANQKSVKMIENELNLLSSCEHERVVAYLGTEHRTHADALGNTCHNLLIFMEFMAGGSVKDVIRSSGALEERRALHYTAQVLQGLAYLHKIDIVHRDIKCANILLDESGKNVKIGDFGSSKHLKTTCVENGGLNETMEGTKSTVGTILYMAPEVVMNIPYARRADVWSTGCSLVEMLCGAPPWQGCDSELAVMLAIATSPHPRYTLPYEVTECTRDLLNLMFIKDFQQRPYAWTLLEHQAVKFS